MASSGYSQLASWAVKWGRVMMDRCDEIANEPEPDTTEIDALEDELKKLKSAADDLVSAIEETIVPDKIDRLSNALGELL